MALVLVGAQHAGHGKRDPRAAIRNALTAKAGLCEAWNPAHTQLKQLAAALATVAHKAARSAGHRLEGRAPMLHMVMRWMPQHRAASQAKPPSKVVLAISLPPW